MRLWTLHPSYLDSRGLVALWREALLAQKVLASKTRGYRHHPQLQRFRAHPTPSVAIASYLHEIALEGRRRGYRFDESRIIEKPDPVRLTATEGQLLFEWQHLLRKLRGRAAALALQHATVDLPRAHPIFDVIPGPVAEWERGAR